MICALLEITESKMFVYHLCIAYRSCPNQTLELNSSISLQSTSIVDPGNVIFDVK